MVGVRHLAHTEPDPRWPLRPDVDDGLALLAERGLTFDVCAETVELLEPVWSATATTTAGPTPAERARVLGGTAREVYRLDPGAGEP